MGISDQSVIPRISDPTAYRQNIEAIDQQVKNREFRYVIAWGKWLGFTPESVQDIVDEAIRDAAPHDAIQKIDGRWIRITDIQNEVNRSRVAEIAEQSAD